MSVIRDFLAWIQRGLQAIAAGVVVRIREEPVATVALARVGLTAAVGFGLGWSGEQVALFVGFLEALTFWIARQEVTPTSSPQLSEGQPVRLPDGTTATVVKD